MFHSFFNSQARSHFLHSFNSTQWFAGTVKSTIRQVLSFLLIIIRFVCLSEIRFVCLKIPEILCMSFFRTGSGLCIDYLLVRSNLNFLHKSQWIFLPIESCLVLYSFYANLLYSLIMSLMVSSLSPHNRYLLYYCVLSIFALLWFVLMVLFCPAIRRDSLSRIRFPFLSHIHVFSCKMLLGSRLKRP